MLLFIVNNNFSLLRSGFRSLDLKKKEKKKKMRRSWCRWVTTRVRVSEEVVRVRFLL